MLKKLIVLLFFISYSVQSQHFVKGTMNPTNEEFTWVALYQLVGSKQIFIKNGTLENGMFSIEIPENSAEGMYRLHYEMDNINFVDFIFTNKNVELEFDPSKPSETIKFSTSEENILYSNYLNQTNELKQQLNSIQYSYFNLQTENEKNDAAKLYEIYFLKHAEVQEQFEENSIGKLANHFIKASKKYYAQHLIETPQVYLNSEKKHFFDFINFSDETLINSTFITQNVLDYVFYLNVSEDFEVQNILHKNAINEVLGMQTENIKIKRDLITTLLYAFAQNENITIVDYLKKNHYNKLPNEYKTDVDIDTLLESLKLVVGRKAPDFSWEENGTAKSLYELNSAETYMLVFWSTSCSHCLNEVPELYEYTKDKTNIHVIDIALENDAVEFEKYTKIFKKWSNVLGFGKWENNIARNYKIVSTPTYFILDANKKMIAKPEFIEDVKAFFKD